MLIYVVYFVLLELESNGVFDSIQGGNAAQLRLTLLLKGRRHAGSVLKEATPRMILEKGLRFQSVGQRSELGTLLRHAVVTNDISKCPSQADCRNIDSAVHNNV